MKPIKKDKNQSTPTTIDTTINVLRQMDIWLCGKIDNDRGLILGKNRFVAYIVFYEVVTVYRIKDLLNKPWSYKWVAKPIGYLLSEREREEWFGDLLDIKDRMIHEDKYPMPLINLIITVKTVCLIGSKISCLFVDVISNTID